MKNLIFIGIQMFCVEFRVRWKVNLSCDFDLGPVVMQFGVAKLRVLR
jgi:hypothetical protein